MLLVFNFIRQTLDKSSNLWYNIYESAPKNRIETAISAPPMGFFMEL